MRLSIGVAVLIGLGSGCGEEPTSVRLTFRSANELRQVDDLVLRVYHQTSGVVATTQLGDATLPDDVVVIPAETSGELRFYATADLVVLEDPPTTTPAWGWARVVIERGNQLERELVLAAGEADDDDGDGVPDEVDNCPQLFNPDQLPCGGPDGGPDGDGPPSAPVVVSTSPADGASGVAVTANLRATFSVDMDATRFNSTTVKLVSQSGAVSGAISYSSSLRRLTFSPDFDLDPDTGYTAQIGASVRSSAGLTLGATYSWSFTTAAEPTFAVDTTSPADGATDVAHDSAVSVAFTDSVNEDTVGPSSFSVTCDGQPVAGDHDVVAMVVTFTADQPFDLLASCDVRLDASISSTEGQTLGSDSIFSFTTADGSWETPGFIDRDYDAGASDLAVGAGGHALLVWQEDHSPMEVVGAHFTPPASWSAPQTLQSTGNAMLAPRAAIASDGHGYAVWYVDALNNDPVFGARYAIGAGWSAAEDVDELTDNLIARDPMVGIGDDHTARAVWLKGPATGVLSVATAASSDWSDEEYLETLPQAAAAPQIAVNPAGDAVVAWRQYDGARYDVQARIYRSGSWNSATTLDTLTYDAEDPRVAIDHQGNALVIWRQRAGSYEQVFARRFLTGSQQWDASLTQVSTTSDHADSAVLAVGPTGQAAVAWLAGSKQEVFAACFDGTSWRAQTRVSAQNADARSPAVAVDPRGNALLIWQQKHAAAEAVYASRYTAATGQWTLYTPYLQYDSYRQHDLRVGIGADGRGVAAWTKHRSTNNAENVWYALFR